MSRLSRSARPQAFLACLVATASIAVGCGQASPEAGQPNTSPPPASSANPSTTATSKPAVPSPVLPSAAPTRPPAAEGPSLAAGEAFIAYYIDLVNYAYATGDPATLAADSDRGCIGCKGLIDYARRINVKNGGLVGDYKDHLVGVKEIFRGNSGRLGGSASITSGTYTERQSPGASPVAQGGSTGTMEFTLSPSGGNWVMFEMEIKE